MSRRPALLVLIAIVSLAASCAPALAAVPKPAWSISPIATPTNFVPGDVSGDYSYEVTLTNSGGERSDGSPVTIVDTLPAGLTVNSVKLTLAYRAGQDGFKDFGTAAGADSLCEVEESTQATVSCTLPPAFPSPPFAETVDEPSVLWPGEALSMLIRVSPTAVSEGETLTNVASVEGGGAAPVAVSVDNKASSEVADRGFAYFRAQLIDVDGEPLGQAATHPYAYTTAFAFHTAPGAPGGSAFVPAGGDLKDVHNSLPPGLAGNPNVAGHCTAKQFVSRHTITVEIGGQNIQYTVTECPESSVVGFVLVQQLEGQSATYPVPLFNMVPPPGVPAQLAFSVAGVPFHLDAEVRSGGDYGIDVVLHNNSEIARVTAATVTVWGTPGAAEHDRLRGSCLVPAVVAGQWSAGECAAGIAVPKPFFRAPSSCESALQTLMSYSTYSLPNDFLTAASDAPAPSGCNQVEFDPSLQARPTTDVADSPSGLAVDLHIPQKENEDPAGRSQADLRDTTVTLPEGLVINPSGANGLGACTIAQIGYLPGTSEPEEFTPDPPECTPSSRIGTVEVDLPAIDHTVKGSVYAATPHQNPFDSLLAIYITVDDPVSGVVLKLPGEVHADPQTGRLTTTVQESPQQPFEDFRLRFFEGAGAPLRTPAACGVYSTTSSLTPWSAPESGPPASPGDAYEIKAAPGGGSCPASEGALPHAPSFDAGTTAPIARAFSPFVMHLRRADGSQELSTVSVTLPPGLTGKLAGIPYCPEAALATAATKSGNAEKQSPSCPAASEVGTVTVGAGAGPAPYYTTGRLYLTGPYKGAPLGFAVVTPAAAGPYDLGTVVSRVALDLDPETAKITATSDPIPRILQGIPLDVRSILVNADRPGFTLNPTSCDPMSTTGSATSVLGQVARLFSRFQVGECSALPFKPKLSFKLTGKTNRGAHPALKAVLKMPAGGANIAKAAVALPRSEFIDQAHFQTICTRVQYAEGDVPGEKCPAGSIYGFARATTPLLDAPLEGPVYLRSSSHKLPDLVISLDGQVHIDAVGRVDSFKGGIRTTFESVPDAPVSSLVLTMQGGRKGLFVNSTNICAKKNRATVEFDGQNGKVADSRPLMKAQCKGGGAKGRRHKGGR